MASVTVSGWGSDPLGGTIGVLHGGAKLRVAHWPGEPSGPGTIILVQGRAEFIEVYAETIADFSARGFAVVTFDLRGQGGSERSHRTGGHVRRIADYGEDIAAVVRYAKSIGLPRPYHVVAHSTGGLAALVAMDQLVKDVDRMVLLAPLMEIPKLPISPGLGRLWGSLMLGFGLGHLLVSRPRDFTPFERNKLTSDQDRYARLLRLADANPDLMTGPPTYAWVAAVLQSIKSLERRHGRPLSIPTLFVASSNDEIVGTSAIERFAGAASGGGLVMIKGAKHQVMLERDAMRRLAFAAIDAFLEGPARLPLDLPKGSGRVRFEAAGPSAAAAFPTGNTARKRRRAAEEAEKNKPSVGAHDEAAPNAADQQPAESPKPSAARLKPVEPRAETANTEDTVPLVMARSRLRDRLRSRAENDPSAPPDTEPMAAEAESVASTPDTDVPMPRRRRRHRGNRALSEAYNSEDALPSARAEEVHEHNAKVDSDALAVGASIRADHQASREQANREAETDDLRRRL